MVGRLHRIIHLTPLRRAALRSFDVDAIRSAIDETEAKTSVDIRVSFAPWFWGDVDKAARKVFRQLDAIHDDDIILLYFIVPSRRRFVIIADDAINAKVAPVFWERLASDLSEQFHAGDFTGGLIKSVNEAGSELARHFPESEGRSDE